MNLLVTGGTGSFGSAFIARTLDQFDSITCYSRDEHKQAEMRRALPSPRLKFVVGDIRDLDHLTRVLADVDVVVHAAAMKHVDICERNPSEAIDTNVIGSRNVALASRGQVVALSTDKAAVPTNTYGATKMLSDRLFLAAGHTVVRCGNIFASRGSVVPLFLSQRPLGVVTITDPRMTRYSITVEQAVATVLAAVKGSSGSEMWVPKMPSYRIGDVAEACAPGCRVDTIGLRPGERLHECLITEAEAECATDCGSHYVIGKGGHVAPQFSDTNETWLTVDAIRGML